MAEQTASAYEMSLDMLEQTPAQFLRSTPAETYALLAAFRRRSNRANLRTAWILAHVLAQHANENSDISVMRLFENMPGSFPSDLPKSATEDAPPRDMTPDQQKEWHRRRNKQRLTRP